MYTTYHCDYCGYVTGDKEDLELHESSHFDPTQSIIISATRYSRHHRAPERIMVTFYDEGVPVQAAFYNLDSPPIDAVGDIPKLDES